MAPASLPMDMIELESLHQCGSDFSTYGYDRTRKTAPMWLRLLYLWIGYHYKDCTNAAPASLPIDMIELERLHQCGPGFSSYPISLCGWTRDRINKLGVFKLLVNFRTYSVIHETRGVEEFYKDMNSVISPWGFGHSR